MTSDLPSGPLVAGTIHSPAALKEALRLRIGDVDLLEVRVDHFVTDLKPLTKALPKLPAPLIITVRHPREGGAAPLSMVERKALYCQFLGFATMIDVELQSAARFESLRAAASDRGISTILSWHDFRGTPNLAALHERWVAAAEFRPDIIKFATATHKAAQLATLVSFLTSRPTKPATSLMGMHTLGRLSRLALGGAGSRLNYGYLGELQVPGQWPAKLLKIRLAEIASA